MSHLDLLLSLARITIVTLTAVTLGAVLLRRRPDAVPALAISGLLSGCVLLAIAGADWPTIWHASVEAPTPTTVAGASAASTDVIQPTSPGYEVSWSQFAHALQRLDSSTPDSAVVSVQGVQLVLAALLMIAIVRTVIGLVATVRLHRTSRVVTDTRLSELLAQNSFDAPSQTELTFRVSDRIDAPCVTAIDRRSIYLPENWVQYSDDELLAAVAHEVAHLSRRDASWRLLAQVATAAQVFHPLAHRLLRQLVLGQELAADERAAGLIGTQRFIRGISQLALRLDAGAVLRPAQGIGMSHSSSFLIRRITMLRNGMSETRRESGSRLERSLVVLVVAAAVVSASWRLSAEEPVRVAARTATGSAAKTVNRVEPWQLLPGRSGYWSVNVEALWKDPVISQWLGQAELMFLTPGWSFIAAEDAADRRVELGLSLSNVASVGGEVTMSNKRIEDPDSEETFHSTVKAGEFVFHMRDKVDWSAVADSLAKDRLHAAIAGLAGPEFPEESAGEIIADDIIGKFFSAQTDPLRLLLKQNVFKTEEEERPQTPAAIPGLWMAHRGQLATLLVAIPETPLGGETEFEKAVESFPQSAEFYIVGVDPSEKPGHIHVRVGFSPRSETSLDELKSKMTGLIAAGIKYVRAKSDSNEPLSQDEQAVLNVLENATPEIVEPTEAAPVGIVTVHGDIPAAMLPLVFGG